MFKTESLESLNPKDLHIYIFINVYKCLNVFVSNGFLRLFYTLYAAKLELIVLLLFFLFWKEVDNEGIVVILWSCYLNEECFYTKVNLENIRDINYLKNICTYE